MRRTPHRGLFVTATGTGVGKTFLTRALARALRARGQTVLALKPVETGCLDGPLDATSLALASGHPDLAHNPHFYRFNPPLAPAAAALLLGSEAPAARPLAAACLRHAHPDTVVLVEGAGGLLVPLNARENMADLAVHLGFPICLVALDALGTLSHTLTAYESACARGLTLAAVIVNRASPDPRAVAAGADNAAMLRDRLPIPVHVFPVLDQTNDDALCSAVEHAGLLNLIPARKPTTP